MSAIEIKNLTKYYGDFLAVSDVSFTVNKGEVLGLLGPNGAGKSTTIRSLCGYLEPSGGSIRVNGLSVIEDPQGVKQQIGYLPESAPLYGDMMVYDYLSYVAEIRNVENPTSRIKDLADMCGLREKMHVNINALSKGFKQRVGLAHAMMSDPEVLVLDEPTSGLDPNQIAEIRDLIRRLGKEKTVILSTHIMQEVEAVCDRVIIISRGTIKANDTTKSLKSDSSGVMEVSLEVGNVDFDTLKKEVSTIPGVTYCEPIEDAESNEQTTTIVKVRSENKDDIRPLLFQKIKSQPWTLYEMKRETRSLENIFRDLTRN